MLLPASIGNLTSCADAIPSSDDFTEICLGTLYCIWLKSSRVYVLILISDGGRTLTSWAVFRMTSFGRYAITSSIFFLSAPPTPSIGPLP